MFLSFQILVENIMPRSLMNSFQKKLILLTHHHFDHIDYKYNFETF
jgi:L-ascorbate metabolism protein UlaG (beta-lactamase superfamily)